MIKKMMLNSKDEKRKEQMREYGLKHKKEKKEYLKKYYINHREDQIEASRARYVAKKEEILEKQGEYNIKHREGINKRQREYERKRKEENPWFTHYKAAEQRCNNPNSKDFPRYGGRGIKFLLARGEAKYLYERDNAKDMERPSIDRTNNDGDYVFGNCRFIEVAENTRRRFRQ